jgi:enamine deaminase RidA (YjgF/YER057c/UK114 family)
MKEFRNPSDVPAALPGSTQQIEISRNERLLILSGQVGRYEDGSVPDDPILQFGLACENMRRNLRLAGMDMVDLVKMTFYVVGEMDSAEWNKVLAYRLGEHKPCMTLVYVNRLADPACKVEIDAWASRVD